MRVFLFATISSVLVSLVAHGQDAEIAPNAKAGACFAKVLMPDTIETVTERILKREATSAIAVTPATFREVTDTHLVKDASTVYRTIPPVFETVTETVVLVPEQEQPISIPAMLESYTEQVLVRDAYTTWALSDELRAGACETAIETVTLESGQIFCRIEMPAEYETVTKIRQRSPAQTQIQTIPARTKTITKQVLVEPARVVEEVLPAEYETVTRRELATPAETQIRDVPATYQSIEKQIVRASGGFELREVLCAPRATPDMIRNVQIALNAAGYSAPSDGMFGPDTRAAMTAFQRANSLPIGDLTISTLDALGINGAT